MKTISQKIRSFLKDPFRINRDWISFEQMSDEELREEHKRLLDEDPCGDRFRRLCHFLSAKWVYIQPLNREAAPIDANVQAVQRKMLIRADRGLKKYGVTTQRPDLELHQWLQHAQEEAMDLAVYLERLMKDERWTLTRAIELRDLSSDEIRLRWGELTNQEIRTLRAVLNSITPPRGKQYNPKDVP